MPSLGRPARRAGRVWLRALLLVSAAASCATTGAPGGAVRSRSVGSDDRVVVRRHTDILAVSASVRHMYAVSTRGLLVFDRVVSQWRVPSSRVHEDLALAGLTDVRSAVLAADPIEDAVWVGVPGAVVLYRAQVEQVQRITVVGQPDVIAFARGDTDAYVRASGQWLRVSRSGFVTPIIGGIGSVALAPSPQLGDVYQQYPALRGQLPFLLRDETAAASGFAAVTSGTFSPDQPSEVWIGTRNNGVWRVDANFMRAERLAYGVRDDMIGALASGRDGVWTGGQGRVRDAGLGFVHHDLQRFSSVDGNATAALSGARTTTMAVRANRVWVGTDRGVVRVQTGTTTGVTPWGALHGLPAEMVTAIVPLDAGAWVGTSRGLAFVHDTSPNLSVRSRVATVAFAGQPVRSLLRVTDSLFVGTNDGLFAMSARVPAADSARHAPRRVFAGYPALVRPVQALAWSDSLLLVVTDRRALLVPLRDAMRGAPLSARAGVDSLWFTAPIAERELLSVGVVVTAAMDARALWIAGSRGVLALAREGGALRVMVAGSELPGEITALALEEEWAWIGTNNGLVRVRRARDGGLP